MVAAGREEADNNVTPRAPLGQERGMPTTNPRRERMVRFAATVLASQPRCSAVEPMAREILLLDFWSPNCGPCLQMKPTIRIFEQAKYPIRQIDTTREPMLARQHGVERIPCFVMLVDNQEVDRKVGSISSEELQEMFARAKTIAEDARTRPRPIARNESAWSNRTVARGNVVRYRSQAETADSTVPVAPAKRSQSANARQAAGRDRSAARGRSQEPCLRHGNDHRLPRAARRW